MTSFSLGRGIWILDFQSYTCISRKVPMRTSRHLEKVLAHAESRLAATGTRRPTEVLPLYKKFLKVEEHRLRLKHQAGVGGREICVRRAELVDILLRYVFDAAAATVRGRVFYTNIEEAGKTVAIDVRSHKVVAEWKVHDDLQGLTLDSARGFLFVACGDHVVSLDVAHGGRLIDSLVTGPGLDNIDFSPDKKLLYAAASVTATLSIIEVGDDGKFRLQSLVP